MHVTKLFRPASYFRFIRRELRERALRAQANFRGATIYPPGHPLSPLLDIEGLGANGSKLRSDDAELWEHVDMRAREQRSYYEDLIEKFPVLSFPDQKTDKYRYFRNNIWFPISDAFTLSGIMRKEQPRRIIEVGSGFSSAVMLDTLESTKGSAMLTFVEPDPQRLYALLSSKDQSNSKILPQLVQEVPLSVFDELEAQDVLFIDSSHVAKVGSDVTHIVLRILPRLKPGVFIHFHDIFYPFSYPIDWIRMGRAWNESLFLRAFLMGNKQFEIVAFNCFAGCTFPEVFRERFPAFLENTGGSIWIRKTG